MKHMRIPLLLVLGGLTACFATAQDAFPSRPLTIVIPYPAGGTSDSQMRMIQEPLSKLLGQPVIIDNKPGASGAIAAQAVARAKPDGYTLLYPNNGVLIATLLNDKLGYDAIKDFKPISTVTAVPMVLVTNKSVPATDLAEFLKYVKKQQKGIMYASAGTASYGHLASARFAQMAGIKVEHIPYKGEAGTTMAVRGGDVQMLLTTPSSAMLGQVKEGNLTMLGVATETPSAVVPDVPTINKVVPGFTSEVWFGLLAPAGTPDDVIMKLNAAVKKVMADEAVRAKLLPTGALPYTSTPTEFATLMSREQAQWRDIITKYKIKAD
ncbi:MAG: ABC transporter substrate-binding protein [Burkholderiales bacterium]|nr:MAG: ABC transporter substrate-binding protein [Burkholderiales bacterium]